MITSFLQPQIQSSAEVASPNNIYYEKRIDDAETTHSFDKMPHHIKWLLEVLGYKRLIIKYMELRANDRVQAHLYNNRVKTGYKGQKAEGKHLAELWNCTIPTALEARKVFCELGLIALDRDTYNGVDYHTVLFINRAKDKEIIALYKAAKKGAKKGGKGGCKNLTKTQQILEEMSVQNSAVTFKKSLKIFKENLNDQNLQLQIQQDTQEKKSATNNTVGTNKIDYRLLNNVTKEHHDESEKTERQDSHSHEFFGLGFEGNGIVIEQKSEQETIAEQQSVEEIRAKLWQKQESCDESVHIAEQSSRFGIQKVAGKKADFAVAIRSAGRIAPTSKPLLHAKVVNKDLGPILDIAHEVLAQSTRGNELLGGTLSDGSTVYLPHLHRYINNFAKENCNGDVALFRAMLEDILAIRFLDKFHLVKIFGDRKLCAGLIQRKYQPWKRMNVSHCLPDKQTTIKQRSEAMTMKCTIPEDVREAAAAITRQREAEQKKQANESHKIATQIFKSGEEPRELGFLEIQRRLQELKDKGKVC